MKKKYKWGILAPGKMSAKFTRGLQLLENVELYAVGSRDINRAKQFAEAAMKSSLLIPTWMLYILRRLIRIIMSTLCFVLKTKKLLFAKKLLQ
jgi:hypothetical protein